MLNKRNRLLVDMECQIHNTVHHLFRAVTKHHRNRLQCQDMAHHHQPTGNHQCNNHYNTNNRRHNSKLQCSKAMDSNNRHLLRNLDQAILPGKLTA